MKKLILFAGTTEGRRLAGALETMPYATTVCVATEYGKELLDAGLRGGERVLDGRLDADGMAALLRETGADIAVDATHPYAAEVTKNIRVACARCGVRLLRLLRAPSDTQGCLAAADAREAAQLLCTLSGRVLLTTGSKELDLFTQVPDFAARLYPRVLPTADSVQRCAALGYLPAHVIAMQGPFSKELNLALLREFGISLLVTKDGGAAGGFREKLAAAREAGAQVIVIGRPAEAQGLGYEEVLRILREEQE